MLSETISTGYDDSLAELKDLQNLVKNLSGHETAISKDTWSRELSSLSSVVSGCEVYGIYRMDRQEFVETYKSDPIFRCKVGIMFKEEKEMLERHPEYRAIKRTLSKQNEQLKDLPEFQEGNTFRKRVKKQIAKFLENCHKFRGYMSE